jgi:hypothetical protein
VILLTPGELLASRVGLEALAAYLKQAEAALRGDWDEEALAGLSLRIELRPGQLVTIQAAGPGVDDVDALCTTVGRISPVPEVTASVVVEIAFRAENP